MRTTLKQNCPELVAEWDYDKNAGLDPAKLAKNSHKKVWWLCSKGHSWEAKVYNRSGGRGCPYCSGRRPIVGENDLATTHASLIKEWDADKNEILPSNVSSGSDKKVWWKCNSGHSWEATVSSRALGGNKCPYCAGLKPTSGINDLATLHPELLAEWDFDKNIAAPSTFTKKSGKKVWWRCSKGHGWEASVSSRTGLKSGCPYCSGRIPLAGKSDLATTNPSVAAEWDVAKNTITPSQVSRGSDKKVWWRCSKGHSWKARVANRVAQSPERPASGCPMCYAKSYASKPEKELLDFVRSLDNSAIGSYKKLPNIHEVDIYVPSKNIAIEYNGLYWHSENFKGKGAHYNKWKECKKQGIQLIQIWEDEWLYKPEIVKSMLAHKLGLSKEPAVYARKTRVKEIASSDAATFFTANHIQGAATGSIKIGLYNIGDELVACSIFKKRGENTLELVRYASSCRVIGGQGKILKYIKTNFPEILKIVTFADHCVSNGNLYESLGFSNAGELRPDYKYIVGYTRVHKFNYRLKRFKNDPDLRWVEGLTEHELAKLNGLCRVYDAGKTKYVLMF